MKLKSLVFAMLTFVFLFFSSQATLAQDLPKDSLYQLDTSSWKDQNGESSPLKKFAGQTVVIAMTYTGCQYACPMTLNKLDEIEKAFKKKGLQNYRFVIASFDPDKDKPEALKAYMKKRNISEKHWTFLSPTSDTEVRKLAVLLNISYQKIDGGDFSHGNAISLLDHKGRIDSKLAGLTSPHEEFVEKAASYEKQNLN